MSSAPVCSDHPKTPSGTCAACVESGVWWAYKQRIREKQQAALNQRLAERRRTRGEREYLDWLRVKAEGPSR